MVDEDSGGGGKVDDDDVEDDKGNVLVDNPVEGNVDVDPVEGVMEVGKMVVIVVAKAVVVDCRKTVTLEVMVVMLTYESVMMVVLIEVVDVDSVGEVYSVDPSRTSGDWKVELEISICVS